MDNFTETAELQLNITSNASAFEALMNSVMQSAVDAANRAETAWSRVGSGMSEGVAPGAMQASSAMKQVGDDAESAATRTNDAWQQAGMGMALVGGMMLAPIKDAVSQFVTFDAALHNVAAEGAAGGMALSDMAKQFQSIGEASGQSATALAEADYKVGAAGYQGAAGMQFMSVAAKTATADQADLSTTSQALIAIMGAYKNATGSAALGTNDLQKASDLMLATVGGGVMRLDEFSANIAKVAPLAGQMGVGLAEVGAGLDVLTKQGLTATQATNELNAILSALLKPSKDLAAHFQEDGIASGEALLQARGFGGALEYLREASGGSDEELAHMIPNIRAIKGEISLASGEFQGYNDALATMNTATQGIGRTQEAFNEQTHSAKFALDQMKAAMEAAGESAMSALAPALTAIASAIKGVADFFASLPQPVQSTIVAFTALTGGALVLGGAFAMLSPAITAISVALGGLLGPIALVAAGAAFIISNWQGIGDFFGQIGQSIGKAFAGIGSMIGDALKNAWDSITGWIQDTSKQMFDAGVSWVAQLASGIIMAIPNWLGNAASQVGSYIVDMFSAHSDPPAAPGLTAAGASWVAQLGKGMTSADFSFVDQIGQTLTIRFAQILGPNNKFNIAEAVFGTQSDISAVIDAFRTGGDNVDQLLNKVRADLQGQNSDVVALVQAYLALQQNLAAVNTLEQDKLRIQAAYAQSLTEAQGKIDTINGQLATENDAMNQLKLTAIDQEQQLQSWKEQLDQANQDLQDANTYYQSMSDMLTTINDQEKANLDVINQQIGAITYQNDVASRGANANKTQADRAYNEEQQRWAERQDQLKLQIDQAGGSGKTGTAAGNALAKQMADEQAQHDQRMLQLDLQKRQADDVVTGLKNKEEDTLTPLKEQVEDVQHANDAQKNGIQLDLDKQKIVVDTAKTSKDAAQALYDENSRALTVTKSQEASEQLKIDKLTIEKGMAQENYNAIKKVQDAQLSGLDQAITALKAQQPILTENLNMANDRVKAEDQVVSKINEQTTAMDKQAKAAGSASALAKAEKERVAPIQDRVTGDKSELDKVKLGQTEALAPLQVALDEAKQRGDKLGVQEAQARLDSMKATWDARVSPYQEQYNVDSNLLDQVKNKAITVNDAISQSDQARIAIGAEVTAATKEFAGAADAMYGDAAKSQTAAADALKKHLAILQTVDAGPYHQLSTAMDTLKNSGISLDQAQALFKPIADKMKLTPAEVKMIYDDAMIGGGQLTQGAIDGLLKDFPSLTKQVDIVKNSGLTVADALKSSNPTVAAAAKDISQALINSASATLGTDSGASSPMFKMGGSAVTNLTLGQASQLNNLTTSSNTVGATVVTGITTPLDAAAKSDSPLSAIGKGLINGVLVIMGKAVADPTTGASAVGAAIGQGIGFGIDTVTGLVESAAGNIIKGALAAAKAAAKTGSPSRLFAEEIGIPIAQGIGVGITEGTVSATSAAQTIIQELLQIMQSAQTAGPTLTAQIAADPTMLQKLMDVATQTTHKVEHHHMIDSNYHITLDGKIDGATPDFHHQLETTMKTMIQDGQVEVVQKIRGIYATLWQPYVRLHLPHAMQSLAVKAMCKPIPHG